MFIGTSQPKLIRSLEGSLLKRRAWREDREKENRSRERTRSWPITEGENDNPGVGEQVDADMGDSVE